MNLQRMLSGDPSRSSMLYIGIGVLSLVKAIAVRNDSTRFRRELLDAGMFIGIGLLLRRYGQLKAQKQAEIREQLPDWIAGDDSVDTGSGGLRTLAKRQFGSEPEPEPTLSERAKKVVSSR